uniref:Kinesin family member 13B n=1 Tax=Cyanoderma ruficeps TaxID=181631 RepID=A0A8C3R2C8_9PASS
MGDSKVKVAVRVRPMNRRELDLHTKCVVDVDANKVILHPVNTNLSKGDARLWLHKRENNLHSEVKAHHIKSLSRAKLRSGSSARREGGCCPSKLCF